MASLSVPIISVVIGEGGSGGALALGVADRILMLEYSIYSVISPRGARRSCGGTPRRSRPPPQLKLTAPDLLALGLRRDHPRGRRRRAPRPVADGREAEALARHLAELRAMPIDALLAARYEKFRRIGHLETVPMWSALRGSDGNAALVEHSLTVCPSPSASCS